MAALPMVDATEGMSREGQNHVTSWKVDDGLTLRNNVASDIITKSQVASDGD